MSYTVAVPFIIVVFHINYNDMSVVAGVQHMLDNYALLMVVVIIIVIMLL